MHAALFVQKRVHWSGVKWLNRLLEPHELTTARFDVLHALDSSGGHALQRTLCRELGLARSTMSVMIRRLEGLGLVIVRRGQRGATCTVQMTEKAARAMRSAVDDLASAVGLAVESFLAGWRSPEMRALELDAYVQRLHGIAHELGDKSQWVYELDDLVGEETPWERLDEDTHLEVDEEVCCGAMSADQPIAVVGDGPLADAVCSELEREGREARRFDAHPRLEDLAGAGAIVIAANDDAKNVDLALTAHQRHPDLPIVVRVFDPVLEQYLVRTAPGIVVNSMSAIAAPVIARTLKDLVGGRFERWDSPLRLLLLRFDRLFVFVVALLCVLTVVGTVFFSWALHLRPVDALYFVVTTLTTTGYGDISPKDAADAVKVAGVVFMVAGACSVAMFFAVMADWVFARRLDLVMGRVPSRWKGHVIIAGAGNMTLRVAQELRDRNLRAIVIERDPDTRAVARLREDGHHVVIADATKDESLRMAGADRAASMLVLTDSDAYNLHIALLARSLNDRAQILARIDSPLLSKHISANDGLVAISPVELAAREFARAALRKADEPAATG